MTSLPVERVPLLVVGAGPAGLTAAAAVASSGVRVVVLERESQPGGIPRHSDHLGYGIRDLRRFMSGPSYARRLTDLALESGAELEAESQVTGWSGPRALEVTSPQGRRVVEADAVVLATGARERPRSARRIPGDRPDGVLTTGQLQNLVHVHHQRVGHQAVVVGAELVSWSAVLTLRSVGCDTVAMTTEHRRSESYAAFRLVGRTALRLPTMTRARVVAINGRRRVESVTVQHLDTGKRVTVGCDTVVMTGDWVPDHELVRMADLAVDAGTLGPIVDSRLHTSAPGVFAAGNLIHPVDTADGAALDGRHVAQAVVQWLQGSADHDEGESFSRLRAAAPLRWVTPQRLVPGHPPPRDQLLLWSDEFRSLPQVRAVQGGRTIGRARTPWPASPGRIFRAPASLVSRADPAGGEVTIELV
jgi:thioredoxin reductase